MFVFLFTLFKMFVACFYDLLKVWGQLNADHLFMIGVGFVTAFIVAYASVIWFLRFLNQSTLASFAYYRFVLAAVSDYFFYGI